MFWEYKRESKLKFNIVEISDKFIFTTKKENSQYVTNLIFFAFDKVAHSLSPNNEQVLEFSLNKVNIKKNR